jgi:thiol:disulfide interchange protein
LETKEVKDLLNELDAVPLVADWTDKSAEIKSTLEELGSRSIPFYAIFPGERPDEPIVLRDLITKGQVLERLREAGPSRSAAPSAQTAPAADQTRQ